MSFFASKNSLGLGLADFSYYISYLIENVKKKMLDKPFLIVYVL